MGKKDAITKDYMNDPRIFADVFNFFMYDGRQVIRITAAFFGCRRDCYSLYGRWERISDTEIQG